MIAYFDGANSNDRGCVSL